MSGLLAAQIVTIFAHLFHNITVADLRLQGRHAFSFHSQMETQVAHDCRDDCVLIQFVALFQIFTADEHDAVAVDNASILIYSDTAIGVAIKCQADIRFFLNDKFT